MTTPGKEREKELVAVGISVAAGCRPCTDYHLAAVRKAGASDEEIKQAVADAVSVRRSATEIMAGYALAQLGEDGHGSEPPHGEPPHGEPPDGEPPHGEPAAVGETNRVKELVSVGAAFAVNCTSNLEKHIAAAEALGVSQNEIRNIVKLATFIKAKAASHVEKLVGTDDHPESQRRTEQAVGCCCG